MVARPDRRGGAADHGAPALHPGEAAAGRPAGAGDFAAARRSDAAGCAHPRGRRRPAEAGRRATASRCSARQRSAGQWDSLVATPADLDRAAIAARAGTALDDIAEVGGIARGIALDGPPSVLYAPAGEGDERMTERPAGARRRAPASSTSPPTCPAARRRRRGVKLHKLSSNETPLGPSPAAIAAYRAAADDAGALSRRRGDRRSATAIAAAHGLNPDRIVCGAGSDEILNLIAHAYLGPGDEAIHTSTASWSIRSRSRRPAARRWSRRRPTSPPTSTRSSRG